MTVEHARFDIAVTGYACRLPGAADANAFWDVLSAGRCTIGTIGADRFPAELIHDPDPSQRGKSYSVAAGQVEGVWDFDPGFFNLSAREALQMDPQQRLLLQVVWEALEHGGHRLADLDGEGTGVYVGASSSDYSNHFFLDLARIDAQFMTGNTLSIISNRVSYLLNLKGPSYTVDTACSSSFYALHQACEALMAGRIDTAIVGGVNLLLSPAAFVGFSRAAMLSPDGLCKAFDASANGYVRSEGAVVFVLRRLAAARASGNRVHGVIEATGINSDGRTVGMALPSAERQAALLRGMVARFGIEPEGLSFVEAHGTGTAVGDPVEASAIGEVFGRHRSTPLPIGSAKTNVGHLEPASGLVGLLKAQLALRHGILPPTLHVREPNPNIPFGALNLALATEPVVLPAGQGPWRAAVNSFGFGGANAHAILRAPRPAEASALAAAPAPRALALSAASAESLAALAAAWDDRLRAVPEIEAAALVNGAAWGREDLPHRLIVPGESGAELSATLARHRAGDRSAAVTGRSTRQPGRTAFVFSGNGAQWAGMGLHLHAGDAAFRARFDEIAALFVALGAEDPCALLADPALGDRLGAAVVAQPVQFALQMGLVAALAAEGLVPDAVAGHSVGEVAAAATAGILSLRDAVLLIHTRSLALDTLRGAGGMAAVSASAADITRWLDQSGITGVALAGINSPHSVTISGARDRLKAFLAHLRRAERVAGVLLEVEIPYHSPAVEPLRRRMIEDLKGLKPAKGEVAYASSTTGQIAHGRTLDTDYWWHNARDVVRFDDAVAALCDIGCRTFVEISPRPVLGTYVRDSLRALGHAGTHVRTLDQGAAADVPVRLMVAQAWAEGASVDRSRFFGPRAAFPEGVPPTPWSNAQFRAAPSGEGTNVFGLLDHHPLLGRASQIGDPVWHADVNPRSLSWLADHAVDGAVVMPAAGFVEMALAAGARLYPRAGLELTEFEILRPLVLDPAGAASLRTTADPLTGAIRIEARARLGEGEWALHAFGTLRALPGGLGPVPDAGEGGGTAWEGPALYAALARSGLAYGPAFRRAARLSVGARAAALVLAPETLPGAGRFVLSPTALDAAMHGVFPLVLPHLGDGLAAEGVFLPVRFGAVRVAAGAGAPAGARIALVRRTDRGVEVALSLHDSGGTTIATVGGLRLQAARLRGRGGRDGLAWVQRLVRLRPRDRAVALPKGWANPANRLRALGIAAAALPEADAGALIVDAAARRLAWDALARLADPAGGVAPWPEGLAEAARPLALRLQGALAEDGVFAPDGRGGGQLAKPCPYPALADLVAALVAEAPQRAAELIETMRLETALPALLAEGPSGEAAQGVDLTQRARAVWPAVTRLALDVAGPWPATDRLNLLVLGAPPPSAIAALLAGGRFDRLTVAHPSDRVVDQMRRTLVAAPALHVVAFADAVAPGQHDVVLSVDVLSALSPAETEALAGTLALQGLLVGVELRPTLARDLALALRGDTGHAIADWPQALGRGFRDVSVQPLASEAVEAEVLTARPRQTALGVDVPEAVAGTTLLVLSDRSAASMALASLIEASLLAAGLRVAQCVLEDAAPLPAGAEEVVHLAHLAAPEAEPLAAAERRLAALVSLLAQAERPRRLWLVTRGAVPLPGRGAATAMPGADAAVWFGARVLANEFPATKLFRVDFAADTTPEALAEELCARLVSASAETEVVIDAHGPLAPRIEPMVLPAPGGAGDALRLALRQQGSLDSLAFRPAQRRAPAAEEVEIEVRATGLNFRDLMWAQGLLPEEALEDGFAGPTLGMECAGVVVRAGSASGYAKGDGVIAFAPACFATHVTVGAEAVAPMPAGTAFETAAAIPTIFVTAQYALAHLARVAPGETVLIHGGAGGVGLAALQIARARGARVFATAGSAAKRRLLTHLGAAAVFDSRALDFAEAVMEATDGTGVDVVLNALAGEAMERSLGCLRPFGRFVELGKRDFYANTRVGLRPFRRNLSYFGVDADQLLSQRPDLARTLLAEVAEGFATATLSPPPVQVFEAAEVVDAFRLLQQSRHVGKIVVRPPPRPAPRPRAPVAPIRGAWLIAGGLGGFGLATADWLADQGAEALWLTGRSGAPRAADAPALDRLRARGITVEVRAVDITDRAVLGALIDEIEGGEVPLRGVVHAAMVLRDALAADLTPDAMGEVMAPKIGGALNLDVLTRGIALDHFVLFSSITTLFGNPGQLPYVAANGYLEALAIARREAGLPGLAIAWGPIGDQGYLARDTRTRDLLDKRLGGRMLTAAEALAGLGRILAAAPGEAAIAYAPMRWGALAGDLAVLGEPLFERIDRGEAGGVSEGAADLLARLDGLDDEAAARAVAEALAVEAARILRQAVGDIDPYQPLTELGFDSLMAMDLKLAAEEAMGVTIPLLSIGDGMTLVQLSARIVAQLRGEAGASTGDQMADRIVARHLGDAADVIDAEIVERVAERAGLSVGEGRR